MNLLAERSVTSQNSIHCMNAILFMNALPGNSIDCIATDPPYGHNNNNNGDLIQRREVALGQLPNAGSSPRPIANDGVEANDLFRRFLSQAARVLKPGCCCCCCCCGGGPDPQFARWSIWMDEVLQFKHMIVWDKGPMGMGWHYRRSYETVLVAMKPGAPCKWYDMTKAVENIIRPGMNAPKIIPRADQHPTEKPVGLFEFFIRLHTQPGDIVLDPFAGSGSALVAARNLNRRFLGCEINLEYVRMAQRRLSQPFTLPMFETLGVATL